MAWQRNYVVLTSGERIRYTFVERTDAGTKSYYVRFKEPGGKRALRSTGSRTKPQAIEAAHRIILEEYRQVAPSAARMPWDAAKAKLRETLETNGKRPATVKGYLESLDKLIVLFPLVVGPADVTDRIAGDFKTRYARGTFSRKTRLKAGEAAPEYARKAKSLHSRIRSLKAVFTWLEKIGLVAANPFAEVTPPALDRHEVKFVREADVGDFFAWLDGYYLGWRMPALFFTVKALTGCRLADLCSLKSAQLQDGRVVFPADATKNRSERYAVLPADVYAELLAYRGPTWIWERYPAELKAVIVKKGTPTHRLNPTFAPLRLYYWVVAMMQDYQKKTGRDLSSHDFRKAAFTRAAEADVHPKRAAVAFDVTPETMLKYYTATEKKATADEVLGGLAARLVPKKKPPEDG